MKRFLIFSLFTIVFFVNSFSQDKENEPTNEQTNKPTPIEKLAVLFPPSILRSDFLLKQYLRSISFAALRTANGDSASIDIIYLKAKEFSRDNTGIALLISLLAVTDHFAFTIKIPVPYLSLQLPLPLTTESKEEFTRRSKNLPEHFPHLFSSHSSFHHKDKLQHFFATALVSYVFESKETALQFGLAAEKGESEFVLDGAYDEEDLEMNRRGALFGNALLSDENIFPSQYFFHRK